MKRTFKIMIWIAVIILLVFGSFILYITLADYKPEEIIMIEENNVSKPVSQDTFDIMNWNIGYAGLGADMDFFYDGGKKVRPTKETGRKYMDGIKEFLSNHQTDFLILQEVDLKAKRSHKMNEVAEIKTLLPDYQHAFATNYKVSFVPVPIYEPMGQVHGGMLNLSKQLPTEVVRYAYPLIASWPNRLFLLDRCFVLSKLPLKSGKDLVIINTHNSAYVYDVELREKELQIIKDKMLEEYNKGNFVVAGGDWNANPPGFKQAGDFNGHIFEVSKVVMRPDLLPDTWKWVFDATAR